MELRYKDGTPMRKYNSPKLQEIEMENKNLTAVEWLVKEIESLITIETFQRWKVLKEQAKQMEKEQIIKHSIGFQSHLNGKGLITDHDWDWEKLAKQYIKKEYK